MSLLFPFPLSWPSVLSDVSVSHGIRKQFSRGLGFCFVGGGELEGLFSWARLFGGTRELRKYK